MVIFRLMKREGGREGGGRSRPRYVEGETMRGARGGARGGRRERERVAGAEAGCLSCYSLGWLRAGDVAGR